MSVALTLAKQHLRVHHNDEDDLIAQYILAANEWIVSYTGENYDPYSIALEQAELLLVGHFYQTREAATAVNVSEVPFAVKALAAPYRIPTVR